MTKIFCLYSLIFIKIDNHLAIFAIFANFAIIADLKFKTYRLRKNLVVFYLSI